MPNFILMDVFKKRIYNLFDMDLRLSTLHRMSVNETVVHIPGLLSMHGEPQKIENFILSQFQC